MLFVNCLEKLHTLQFKLKTATIYNSQTIMKKSFYAIKLRLKGIAPFFIFIFFFSFLIFAEPAEKFRPRMNGNHRPYIELNSKEPDFYAMSMTQYGLNDSKTDQIDLFKKKMLEGTFEYNDERQVSGLFHERSHTYFISEGHHRLAAAFEIAKESGDWSYFKKLIAHGYWYKTDEVPKNRYSLKMRTNWKTAISCHFLLARLVSPRANLFSR